MTAAVVVVVEAEGVVDRAATGVVVVLAAEVVAVVLVALVVVALVVVAVVVVALAVAVVAVAKVAVAVVAFEAVVTRRVGAVAVQSRCSCTGRSVV